MIPTVDPIPFLLLSSSLLLLLLSAFLFFLRICGKAESKNAEPLYPAQWSRKKRWSITLLSIMGILLYAGSFVYAIVNLFEGFDPFATHHLFHLLIGSIITFIWLMILFLLIASQAKEWGLCWKSVWVAILSSSSVMAVGALIVYLFAIAINISEFWLASIALLASLILPIILLAIVLSFLFRR